MKTRHRFNLLFLLMVWALLVQPSEASCQTEPVNTLEAGAVFGMPIGPTPSLGVWHNRVGVRVSGMDWGTMLGHRSWGVQADASLLLAGTVERGHRFGIAVGRGVDLDEEMGCCDWTYAAVAYFYTRSWFFLEAGLQTPLKVRLGNFRDVDGLIQLGYIWRWKF